MSPGSIGGIGGSSSSPPKNLSDSIPTAYKKLQERDDDLDDHDLNDGHLNTLPEKEGKDIIATSANKSVQQSKDKMGAGMKLGVVANAIASCAALSFFSISMILVNKKTRNYLYNMELDYREIHFPVQLTTSRIGNHTRLMPSLLKGLAASFNVNFRFLPMAFQCIVAVVLVEFSRMMEWVKYEPFNFQTALRWSPIAAFFCFMLVSSFCSMHYMNVPMITVFKSLTNLIIVTGDYFWHKQPVSVMILLSLVFMTVGATFAAWNDIAFSAWGYFWMSANCVATASYVLTMKFATRTMKLPKFGMVFYNNLLGFVMMLPIAILSGELFHLRDGVDSFLDREDLHSFRYISLNVFAGCAGFFLNFAALWCVGATSATTYAVVNTVNNCPVSVLGYFLFSSVVTKTQWEFIVINIIGGFIYSGGKIQYCDFPARAITMVIPETLAGRINEIQPGAPLEFTFGREQEQKKKERQAMLREREANSGDVEAVPLVGGTQEEESYKRSPSSTRRISS